jgi:hypothetical protein
MIANVREMVPLARRSRQKFELSARLSLSQSPALSTVLISSSIPIRRVELTIPS